MGGNIGCTLADLDEEFSYLKRTFCLFEVFATAVARDSKLLFVTSLRAEQVKDRLEKEPISSNAAQTRRQEDKEAIDQFIERSIGFPKLDALVTEQILTAAKTLHRKQGFAGVDA